MTLRQSSDPYGYRDLLVYKKAEELQKRCAEFTSRFPISPPYTLSALRDQMDRSAQSVKQNIVEGWKRNSTKEYYEFLGFSTGANAELEEDCNDIIKGVYKGIKGVEMGMNLNEIERLRFYPLDEKLPEVVKLKLRCKELNMLFAKLQRSLQDKMIEENSTSQADKRSVKRKSATTQDAWFLKTLEEQGLLRAEDGQIIPKGTKGI